MTLIDPRQDKFCQFLTAALEALCLLLEVTAFADIGKVRFFVTLCDEVYVHVGFSL